MEDAPNGDGDIEADGSKENEKEDDNRDPKRKKNDENEKKEEGEDSATQLPMQSAMLNLSPVKFGSFDKDFVAKGERKVYWPLVSDKGEIVAACSTSGIAADSATKLQPLFDVVVNDTSLGRAEVMHDDPVSEHIVVFESSCQTPRQHTGSVSSAFGPSQQRRESPVAMDRRSVTKVENGLLKAFCWSKQVQESTTY